MIYVAPAVLREKVSKRASAKIVYAAGRYYIAVENSARYGVPNVYAHKRILINSPPTRISKDGSDVIMFIVAYQHSRRETFSCVYFR